MERCELRTDILTGVVSAHPDLSAKPFPHPVRTLPTPLGPCALCAASNDPVIDGFVREPDGSLREVFVAGNLTRVLANRWSPLGHSATAELLMPRRHVTSFEDLSDDELVDLFATWCARRQSHVGHAIHNLAFANVGYDAGATQPHLHAQVVSTDLFGHPTLRMNTSPEAVLADVARAEVHNLVIASNDAAITYAPYAPANDGELRIAADTPEALAFALRDLIVVVNDRIGPSSYNLVLHGHNRLVAQVVPRVNHGILYTTYLGLVLVVMPPATLATRLRD